MRLQGSIEAEEVKTVNVNVTISMNPDDIDETTLYILTVNGRILKRMSPWQYRRLLGYR